MAKRRTLQVQLDDIKKLSRLYGLAQILYWIAYFFILSYHGAYLLEHGFTNTQVGITLAVGGFATVISQSLFHRLTDRFPDRSLSFISSILMLIVAGLVGLLYPASRSKPALFLIVVLTMTCYNTIQPVINSICIRFINQGYPVDFSSTRGLASFFYAMTASVFGYFIHQIGVSRFPLLGLLPLVLCYGTVRLLDLYEQQISPRIIAEDSGDSSDKKHNILKRYDGLPVFILSLILFFVAYNYFYGFIIQNIRYVGGNEKHQAYVLALGALCETGSMLFYRRFKLRFRTDQLLNFALVAMAIKILLQALVQNPWTLVAIHVLAGIGYGLYLPSSVEFINQSLTQKDEVQGQVLLGASQTTGFVLATLTGGVLIDHWGMHRQQLAAVGIVAVAIILARFSIPNLHAQAELRRKKEAKLLKQRVQQLKNENSQGHL